jgi:hypothetical protein
MGTDRVADARPMGARRAGAVKTPQPGAGIVWETSGCTHRRTQGSAQRMHPRHFIGSTHCAGITAAYDASHGTLMEGLT